MFEESSLTDIWIVVPQEVENVIRCYARCPNSFLSFPIHRRMLMMSNLDPCPSWQLPSASDHILVIRESHVQLREMPPCRMHHAASLVPEEFSN